MFYTNTHTHTDIYTYTRNIYASIWFRDKRQTLTATIAKMINKISTFQNKLFLKINYKCDLIEKLLSKESRNLFFMEIDIIEIIFRYFYNNIFVVLCEKICDGAMEAYLHFIIETGLKKHHTLMELYWDVFSLTIQM